MSPRRPRKAPTPEEAPKWWQEKVRAHDLDTFVQVLVFLEEYAENSERVPPRPTQVMLRVFCHTITKHPEHLEEECVRQWTHWLAEDYLSRNRTKGSAVTTIGGLVHMLRSQGVRPIEVYAAAAKQFGLDEETVQTYEKRYKRSLKSKCP